MEYITKKEFNLRFLWELQRYPPKVARDLLHECRNDIQFKGWWYAQRRWAKFIGLGKEEGTCSVCGSSDWWYRPASELGGPSERLCARCHPKLGEKKEEKSPVDFILLHYRGRGENTGYMETGREAGYPFIARG